MQTVENARIVVERVAGEEKPDGIVFPLQPFRRKPARYVGYFDRLGRDGIAEQFGLAGRRSLLRPLRGRKHNVNRGGRPCPLALKLVEPPRRQRTLPHPLLSSPPLYPPPQIPHTP